MGDYPRGAAKIAGLKPEHASENGHEHSVTSLFMNVFDILETIGRDDKPQKRQLKCPKRPPWPNKLINKAMQ